MLSAVASGLRFYSRLPVPVGPWEREPHGLPDFARLAPVVPVVGLLLGLLPAAALWGADQVGLGPRLAAACCVAVAVLTTGAFHEDGLADTADSFGASTPDRRLEIMRDSRIGTFGAAALVLVLLVRVEALALLVVGAPVREVLAAVLVVAALSRTAPLTMLVLLPPARQDGLSYAVGLPSRGQVVAGWALAVLVGAALGWAAGLGVATLAAMLGAAALTALGATLFARRHVGGHTGDVAGACQQVTEVALLLVLVAWL